MIIGAITKPTNRTVAIMENGSWAPVAAKTMQAMFENSKNITFAENKVTIKIAMNDETVSQLEKLAGEMI